MIVSLQNFYEKLRTCHIDHPDSSEYVENRINYVKRRKC